MTTDARDAVFVPPDGGRPIWLVGDTYRVKLSGEQTGGAFSLSEAMVPRGGGPPPHIHFAEDETFVVLEGALSLSVGTRSFQADAGSVVYVPKGAVHSYQSIGATPARMLFLYSPAGMEAMFGEIGTPARPGEPAPAFDPADVAKLLSVASKYHFELLPPAES